MGFTGCTVETDRNESSFIGAEFGTNATAELSAIAYGCMFAMQIQAPSVLIVYDAKYAANVASGERPPGKNIDW